MKRTIVMSVLAVGSLVLVGCSSGKSGGTSTTAAAATTTSAASSAASSAAGSSGAAPAELDERSVAWFDTLCTGVSPIVELAQSADTSGLSDAAAQQKGVDLISQFGAALSATGESLDGTPPPTFDGGEAFATEITSGLNESGTKMAALATSFGAINPSDTAALEAAVKDLPTQLSSALQPIAAIGDLDPSISSAVQELPACQALGS